MKTTRPEQGFGRGRLRSLIVAAALGVALLPGCATSGGATSSGGGKFDDAAVAQGDLLDLGDRSALAISVDTAATVAFLTFLGDDGSELALVGLDPGLHHRVIVAPVGRYCLSRMKMNSVSMEWSPDQACFDAVAGEITYFGRLTVDEQLNVGLDSSRLKEDFVTFQGRHPDFPAL